MKLQTALLLCALAFAQTAKAELIPSIKDQRCLAAPLEQVLTYATTYAGYAKSPNAELLMDDKKVNLLLQNSPTPELASLATKLTPFMRVLGSVHALKMIASDERPKTPNDPTHSDSLVHFVLRPLNFSADKQSLYPDFWVRCKITTRTPDRAVHTCSLASDADLREYSGRSDAHMPPMRGISFFHSDLDVRSMPCDGTGKTFMNYSLDLTTNDDDVKNIRDSAGVLTPFFDSFRQTDFFHLYYSEFLAGWVQPLQPLPRR